MDSKDKSQPGILAPVPRAARYVSLSVDRVARVHDAIAELAKRSDGEHIVVGLGEPLVKQLGADVAGLRAFPQFNGARVEIPMTQSALWLWLRGDDPGTILHRYRAIEPVLADAFRVDALVDGFRHRDGRDLSGYIDGTENPKGAKARRTAFVAGAGAGVDGSSFVAVQRWRHDFATLDAMSVREKDHAVGRRQRDNVEIESAPASAHVKRTAQEDFEPQAFVVRRSMPWSDDTGEAGLMFVAFGASFDAFEAQMRRMAGIDDGIVDAILRFTQPVSGAYYWCPPITRGRLDLRRVLAGRR